MQRTGSTGMKPASARARAGRRNVLARVGRVMATVLLLGSIATPTTGCAGGPPGLPPPPGGNALPGLLLQVGAAVGTYFLIRELD